MLYKDFEGEQLSSLGFGAMRLPVVDGDNAKIDQDAVNEMVDYALDRGVNYFDTAWVTTMVSPRLPWVSRSTATLAMSS